MFKISTWNVNSLRVRMPHLLDWLETHNPDVIGLQETKILDEYFPLDEFMQKNYHVIFRGQKSYNGVALLSRIAPIDIVKEIPGYPDEQCRFIAATFNDVRVVNLYVPNGSAIGSDKYAYKLFWLEQVINYLQQQLTIHKKLIVMGDFNIAPHDHDVHDPKAWEGQVLVSDLERQALQKLMGLGLKDSFRLHEKGEGHYSWWDYRAAAFRRNMGMRIDHILATPEMLTNCQSCIIDKTPRGLERPSDHAPVIAEFS